MRQAAAPLAGFLPARAWLPYAMVRKANGRWDKPPRGGATSSNPASWYTLEKAIEYCSGTNDAAGVGFAIVKGIIGLDYDNCRNPTTGELTEFVQSEIERLNSFTYVTPSKTGVRIMSSNDAGLRGCKRVCWFPNGQKVEIFIGPTNHYNTFTAEVIPGYDVVRDVSNEVADYLSGLPGSSKDDRADVEPPATAEPQRQIHAIRHALQHIPNDRQNWDAWVRIGLAVYRSSGGSPEGLEAWREWSARHPCHDDGETVDHRWQRFHTSPPTRIGFGTLYREARQHNPLYVAPLDTDEEAPPRQNGKTDFDPETGEVVRFPATPIEDLDLDHIPPREWLYGRELLKGFVSVLGSPGGTGKTAYTIGVGFSVAINRSLLTRPLVPTDMFNTVYQQGPVWFYNLEDPADEMRRRVKALMLQHRLSRADVAGRVFVDSGRDRPLIVTKRDQQGNLITAPVVDDLVAEIKRRGVVLLIIDPFLKTHTAEENRNEEMDHVMTLWGQVAHQAHCAIWLIHHFRKGGQAGDSESFRGAAAIQGGARAMSTLAAMSLEEAGKLGIEPDQRRQYIRLDNAKANMAPSADRAEWYQLVGVNIGNPSDLYPEGDSVQVVEPWEPPSPWEGLAWSTIARVLQKLADGPSTGERYCLAKQSKARWAGLILVQEAGKSDSQAASILKSWVANGVLEEGQYASPQRNGALVQGLSVNQVKAAEMMQAGQGGSNSDD